MGLIKLLRRKVQRELALTTDRHFPPAPRTPPPPPKRPRTVSEMTDRELLEEIHENLDRLAHPLAYWRGGPR